MFFTHLVLCTIVICITSTALATSEEPLSSILNDLASGSVDVAAIGLINQKAVVLFGSSFEQMIAFDTDSTAFFPNDDKHIVLLIGNGKQVSSLWPKLSSAVSQSVDIHHLTTIAGNSGGEYLFAGTKDDQANVLYDLNTKKEVIKASGIKVVDAQQLVSSDVPMTFYVFQSDGSSYQYSLYSVKGSLTNEATSSSPGNNFNFCINQKDSGYVAVFNQGCKGTVDWKFSGGGFSDGQHFHLFTENKQVVIMPMNAKMQTNSLERKGNFDSDDKGEKPLKVIALKDYFGKGTKFDQVLAFLKSHILYAVIGCIVLVVVFVLIIILICCCCCNQAKKESGSGGDEVSVSGHHHEHSNHRQTKTKHSHHSSAPISSRGGAGVHGKERSHQHSHSQPPAHSQQMTRLGTAHNGPTPSGGKSSGKKGEKRTIVGTSTLLPSFATALCGGRHRKEHKAAKSKSKGASKGQKKKKKKNKHKNQGHSSSSSTTKSSSTDSSSGKGSKSNKKKKKKRGGRSSRHSGRHGRRRSRRPRQKMPTLINANLMNSDEAIHRPVPSKKK